MHRDYKPHVGCNKNQSFSTPDLFRYIFMSLIFGAKLNPPPEQRVYLRNLLVEKLERMFHSKKPILKWAKLTKKYNAAVALAKPDLVLGEFHGEKRLEVMENGVTNHTRWAQKPIISRGGELHLQRGYKL